MSASRPFLEIVTSTVIALTASALVACGGAGAPSRGCEGGGPPAGVSNGTIDVAGKARTYVLVLPTGANDHPRPLVFGYHGAGGNGAGIRGYLNLEGPASGSAIFVYPDGLSESGGSTGWPNTSGRDVAFFDALLSKISAETCVDTSRVFVAGFSYGGVMANRLGCERAGVVRAIAPLAGNGPWGTCDGKEVAAWLSFGTSDSYYNTTGRDHWTKTNSCQATSHPVDPAPCVSYDGCSNGHPVTWCEFNGGHSVPSWIGPAVWKFYSSL